MNKKIPRYRQVYEELRKDIIDGIDQRVFPEEILQ